METAALNDQLRSILQDIFGIRPEQYSDRLAMENVSEWDSVQHLTLVLTLEQVFGVQFSPEEWPELTSVQKIKAKLREKASTQEVPQSAAGRLS